LPAIDFAFGFPIVERLYIGERFFCELCGFGAEIFFELFVGGGIAYCCPVGGEGWDAEKDGEDCRPATKVYCELGIACCMWRIPMNRDFASLNVVLRLRGL
jgi:hypothetical protein